MRNPEVEFLEQNTAHYSGFGNTNRTEIANTVISKDSGLVKLLWENQP